jgi:hypothetical protein
MKMGNPTVHLGQNGSMATAWPSQWAGCPWAGGPSTKNRGGQAQGRGGGGASHFQWSQAARSVGDTV